MVFMFRKPKLPCIAFASDNAYAALKYADLDRIARALNGDSFQIYDREGMEFEHLSEHACVAPAFTMGPIRKKDLVAKVFDCRNMAGADKKLRDRNLNNIRFDGLVGKLAEAVKSQASEASRTPTGSTPASRAINTLAG